MPEIEELERRIARPGALYEDVLKERIAHIASRLDQLGNSVFCIKMVIGRGEIVRAV